jgi:hypothetical protein
MAEDRDAEVIEALDSAWARIRAEQPMGTIPKVSWYLTEGRSSGCSTTWDEPVTIRINLLTNDEQNRSGKNLMEYLLHMGAHAATWQPDKPQPRDEGRYHSKEFHDVAGKLGLAAEQKMRDGRPSVGSGFSDISLAEGTLTRYKSEIGKLDRAMSGWKPVKLRPKTRAPIPLVCQCTPQTIAAGLKARGLPPDTGLNRQGTRTIKVPKRIIAPSGVAARGGIVCEDCGQPFVPEAK